MNIHKQLSELTADDIERHPAWQVLIEPIDESLDVDEDTFRPYDEGPADGSCVVRTEFKLADGSVMPGFLFAELRTANQTLSKLQPVIFTENGNVCFWYGMRDPNDDCILNSFNRFKKNPSEVFPISFMTMYPVHSGSIAGIIHSFSGFTRQPKRIWHRFGTPPPEVDLGFQL